VGTRSYGKGSVQEVLNLGPDKGKLKFTSAYYYLSDGKPVKNRELFRRNGRDDWGIAPDIEVPLYNFERQEIRRVNTKRTKVSNTDPAKEDSEEDSIPEKMLSVDPQLATALLVLKAEISIGQ
jgi:carboxyl-terminal processing protease